MPKNPAEEDEPGWTVPYVVYADALRDADLRFADERDRRYTEIAVEKEKALKIKETADLAALSLARDSQTYKEQQNDALRDKNLSESGVYATNASVASAFADLRESLQPLVDFVSAAKGATKSSETSWQKVFGVVGAVAAAAYVVKTGIPLGT